METLKKVLIANRGEIALRIMRTLNRLGVKAVVIYTEHERDDLYVRQAREKYLLQGSNLQETFLDVEQIVRLAYRSCCDAIHPGYGFLAENPRLAMACSQHDILFIGPAALTIELMANKLAANEHVASLGLPVIPRSSLALPQGEEISFPVMVKAVAGGGGKAMRFARDAGGLQQALTEASREALAYFGDHRVYIEKYLDQVRHIEVQVLGDGRGNAVHLFERECTIQRRNQKIIEEAPSPSLTDFQRRQVCDMAVHIASSVNYLGAGTIEFLLQAEQDFYFLEMNTRIQVEHPVTEMITGRDLVADQLFIAQYGNLPFEQHQLTMSGHAMEARIYAEDPQHNFRPSPGRILLYHEPRKKDIRIDSALDGPALISDRYDPMIAKLVVPGSSRGECLQKMQQSLEKYRVLGIPNNLNYLSAVMAHELFVQNNIDTGYCSKHHADLMQMISQKQKTVPDVVLLATYVMAIREKKTATRPGYSKSEIPALLGYWRQGYFFNLFADQKNYQVLLNFSSERLNIYINSAVYTFTQIIVEKEYVQLTFEGETYKTYYTIDGQQNMHAHINGLSFVVQNALNLFERPPQAAEKSGSQNGASETLSAPMHGRVSFVGFAELQPVKKGDVLMIIEAMKMENNIIAPRDGIIAKIHARAGTQVEKNMPLILLK